MSRLDKMQLDHYLNSWSEMKGQIKQYYDERNKEAIPLMQKAIANYKELLICGGTEVDPRTGEEVYKLSPLNGKERFLFIRDKITSHYAYIQLDALYDEVKKKTARLITIQKNHLKK